MMSFKLDHGEKLLKINDLATIGKRGSLRFSFSSIKSISYPKFCNSF